MNINEALYDPDKVRNAVLRLMQDGLTEDEAFTRVAENVIATTRAEVDAGVVPGEVMEIYP